MSIGQLCHYCSHRKMRPFNFSWDQAIVLCDNKKCKSFLEVSPSECIIQKNILEPNDQNSSSELDLECLLNDSSSRSSSGVYSGSRSSMPWSSQSAKSVTDEEVEFMLRSSCMPLSHKDTPVPSSIPSTTLTNSQVSPKLHSSQPDSSKYSSFFELLEYLDLEPQTQPVNPKQQTELISKHESSSTETGFDVVTAELEGWMKDFDFTSAWGEGNPSSDASVGDQRTPDEATEVQTAKRSMQGPSIPSHASAFAPIDTPNEYADIFCPEQNSLHCQRSLVLNNEASNDVQQYDNPCFPTLFENQSVNGNLSNFHTRFMSPTISAASEDSGYNEEDGKLTHGAEPLVSEGNSKVSSKTAFLHSSLRNQTGHSLRKLGTQTNESNLKDLMQNTLEWPVMSEMHTLTVLPAIVATDKSIVNSPQEPHRSPSPHTSQASGSDEISAAVQDIRKQVEFSTELHQFPAISIEHNEHIGNPANVLINDTSINVQEIREQIDLFSEETVSVEHHENILHEIPVSSSKETSCPSVKSPTPESSVSEDSSHSTASEAKAVMGNVDASELCSVSENESKNKRKRSESCRTLRVRKCNDSSTKTDDVPADNSTAHVPKISRVKRKRKRRGVAQIKERAKRKVKSSMLRSKRGKQCSLNKAFSGRLTKRRGSAVKVQLMKHLPTSPGEHYFFENTGENCLDRGDSVEPPGCKTPDAGSCPLGPRGRILTPRKILTCHVNKDPWSVMELSLEELTIEIVVEGVQKEASSLSDKAAKSNMQLQQLMSLFSKENESEVSRVPTKAYIQSVPSNDSNDGARLEGENGQVLSKCEDSDVDDNNGTTINGNDNQNVTGNEQNLQSLETQASTKNFSEESETNVSQTLTTALVQCSSEISAGTSSKNENEDNLPEGNNLCTNDTQEKTNHGQNKQNMMEISQENIQAPENQSSSSDLPFDSDSKVPHIATEGKSIEVLSKVSDGAVLDEESREYCCTGKNFGIKSIQEKTTHSSNQNLMKKSEQNLQKIADPASKTNLNFINTDETNLNNSSLHTFHRLPSELDQSLVNIINEFNCLDDVVPSSEPLLQGSVTDCALQLETNSDVQEHESMAKSASNYSVSEESNSVENNSSSKSKSHSSSKEGELVKHVNHDCCEEDVVMSSDQEGSCSGGASGVCNVKQCSDRQLLETDEHKVRLKYYELNEDKFVGEGNKFPSLTHDNISVIERTLISSVLNKEKFVSEESGHISPSLDTVGGADNTTFETIKRSCVSESGNALNLKRTVGVENVCFVGDCDKNTFEDETLVTSKLTKDKLVMSTMDQICGSEENTISLSPSAPQEASAFQFFNLAKCTTVRSWLGHEDGVLIEEDKFTAEEKVTEREVLSNISSGFSSASYFQSLVEEIDFDESFVQYPLQENPNETVSEHSKSSLFFGETASNDFSSSLMELSEEALPEFKSYSKSNSLSMSLPQPYDNFSDSQPSATYTKVPVPLPSSVAQLPPTSLSINMSPHTVISTLRGKMPRAKVFMIPKNSQVAYAIATPHVANSNLQRFGTLSANLLSMSHTFFPEHSEIGSGSVELKETDGGSKSRQCISNLGTETSPESAKETSTCTEATGNGTSAGTVELKKFSQCFTELSVKDEEREEVDQSSSELVETTPHCEDTVPFSHSPALATQEKESKLGEILRTEQKFSLRSDNADVLSSSVTSKQTGGVGDDCNAEDYEHKKGTTKLCRKEPNPSIENICASGADADSIPTYLDSASEILITITGIESVTSDETCSTEGCLVKDPGSHCCYNESLQRLAESCVADKDSVNKNQVVQCNDHECVETKCIKVEDHVECCENLRANFGKIDHNEHDECVETEQNETEEHGESKAFLISRELKREADDKGSQASKKQKLHHPLSDIPAEICTHGDEGQPSPFHNDYCGAYMCGILDDSVLHDASCQSASHEAFEDSVAEGINKKQGQVVNTYRGKANPVIAGKERHKTRKKSSRKCSTPKNNEDDVSSIHQSLAAKESSNDIDYSPCSNVNRMINLGVKDIDAFNHAFESGSLKGDPHYDGCSYLQRKDVNDLNFFQVSCSYPEFLAPLTSPMESRASTPEPEQGENDSKCCVLASEESKEDEKIDEDTVQPRQSLLHEDVKQTTSSPTVEANDETLGVLNTQAASSHVSAANNDSLETSRTVSQTLGTNIISKVINQLSVSGKEGGLLKSGCNDKLIFTVLGQNDACKAAQSTGTDTSGSQKLQKIIIFRKPLKPSLSVPEESHSIQNTSSTANSVPSIPCSYVASTSGSMCGLSDASSESHPRSQCVAGVTAPHAPTESPSSLSSQGTTPHSLPLTSPLPTSSKIIIAKFARSGAKTQEYPANCQKLTLLNMHSPVPPPLPCSDVNVSPSLALQPLVSADLKGSSVRQSQEIASPPVPSSLPLQPLESASLKQRNVRQSQGLASPLPVPSSLPLLSLVSASLKGSSVSQSQELASSPGPSSCMKDDSKLLELNETNSDTQDDGNSMLKIVKFGSQGSVYLRPTPILKNAILEMRKKDSEESKMEEESSSGFLTLPDGAPISPPRVIPKRNSALTGKTNVQPQPQRTPHPSTNAAKKKKKKRRARRVKDIVTQKVKESLASCEEEIPKMIVIYARKSFHICEIDVAEDR